MFAPPATARRLDREGYQLFAVTGAIHVNRVRVQADEVAAAIADTRAVAGDAGASGVIWWVGDRATPADLGERLAAAGLARVQQLTGMALTAGPAGAPAVEARPCRSFAEFAAAQELDWSVTALDEEQRERLRGRLRDQWKREGRFGRTFVVVDGDKIVSVGRAHYGPDAVFLTGGATAPHARGRGAYTSLVHARWREAADRGTPRLITQASSDSRPILERLGFEALGTITLLRDAL